MTSKPWPWLRDKIHALLTRPIRTDAHGEREYATRVQQALLAPTPDVQPQAAHQ